MFIPGENVVLRGLIDGRLWYTQSVTVVKDTAQETVLLLPVGAACAYPSGYWRWKRGDLSQGTRWDEVKSMAWELREFAWLRNHLLIHMEPDKYFATYLIWEGTTGMFQGYYINYQLPFERTPIGFKTLDLELDIVVKPDFTWSIKDEEGYKAGLREGCITQQQDAAIKKAEPEVFKMISQQLYPMDGSWVDWRPNPVWKIPGFPEGWDQ